MAFVHRSSKFAIRSFELFEDDLVLFPVMCRWDLTWPSSEVLSLMAPNGRSPRGGLPNARAGGDLLLRTGVVHLFGSRFIFRFPFS